MESPFDVLLIDSDADEREVDRAYRRRVKETHPDHGGSAREFQRVRAAYEEIKSEYRNGQRDVGRETGEREHRRTGTRVEYLDYEVLDDHGWSLDDEDLFEKAADGGLDASDHGRFLNRPHESLLQAAENRGFDWPYSCRGGACANCAVAVTEGELSMPADHILPREMTDRGIRLSCLGTPVTDEMQVVYNVKHLPDLQELLLPSHPFERTHLDG